MKKIMAVIGLFLIAVSFLSSCRRQDDTKLRIGIAQIIQHEALDATQQGILDALDARGITAQIDLQNANGDINTATQIANKFRNDRVNIAVGLGTPVAVALANTIRDVPVVFSVVTDPVGARLVTTLNHGRGNVTGLSDALPIKEHIQLFKEVADITNLGFVYTSSEANSISVLAILEVVCRELGINLITQSVNNTAEVRQATESIINRVDGIYLTTDNTVHSAISSLIQVAGNARVPLFSGDVTSARNGGIMIATGFNYYKAGLATGHMVADILLEGRNPAEMPVIFLTDPSESDIL
jgi:putative ABC transport system substrate-binding protein